MCAPRRAYSASDEREHRESILVHARSDADIRFSQTQRMESYASCRTYAPFKVRANKFTLTVENERLLAREL